MDIVVLIDTVEDARFSSVSDQLVIGHLDFRFIYFISHKIATEVAVFKCKHFYT